MGVTPGHPRDNQQHEHDRITMHGILHEVFHFFTHLDKGFPYTLKSLISAPGRMQHDYVEGKRDHHQKPFSMFFVCATISALAYYWVNTAIVKYYDAGDAGEVSFFHQYMVFTLLGLIPILALLTWLFFLKSGYNYAEVLVQQLYTFSFLILMLAAIQTLKFLWPHMETRWVELPLILIYCMQTNIHFFMKEQKVAVIFKTILAASLGFSFATFVQDSLIKLLGH